MIISKTPYRISFFGGGSDYKNWYSKFPGEVISSTINKYIYISLNILPKFYKHKYRLVYSAIENKDNINTIKLFPVKKIFKHFNVKDSFEMHYQGDLPSKSGMGSSSSFVVGLLNILNVYKKKKLLNSFQLANQSIQIEQDILKETVGIQDQIAASYGGFNSIEFFKNNFTVNKLNNKNNFIRNLNKNLILIFTGKIRVAQFIADSYVNKLVHRKETILEILDYVRQAKSMIKKNNYDDFGLLLNEAWKKKRELSKLISNNYIDKIYELGIKNGALGGKLLGAGGGGFILFYVKQDRQDLFLRSFKNFINIPFNFSDEKSRIIFNNYK